MKKIILLCCVFLGVTLNAQKQKKTLTLKNFPQDKVMVVAHRGNWRDAPENSIWAIKKAYEAGANMAEIDLNITKDSVLILLHDRVLDRTTTAKGKPSDYTLAELKNYYLKDGAGHPTQMRIATLEEALQAAQGTKAKLIMSSLTRSTATSRTKFAICLLFVWKKDKVGRLLMVL